MRVLAAALATVAVLTVGPAQASKPPRFPEAQLAAIARGTLVGLGDTHVRRAWAIETDWKDANRILFGGESLAPDLGRARVYAVVLRGRFVAATVRARREGAGRAGASTQRSGVRASAW